MMLHNNEYFIDCCIEEKYDGHTFNGCNFDGAYVENDKIKIINSHFKDSFIGTKEENLKECTFENSITITELEMGRKNIFGRK